MFVLQLFRGYRGVAVRSVPMAAGVSENPRIEVAVALLQLWREVHLRLPCKNSSEDVPSSVRMDLAFLGYVGVNMSST